MNFTIEKNVPFKLPLKETTHYPFAKMELGDSFSFDKEYHTKVSAASQYYKHKLNFKFAIRKDGFGFRIWRVK